MNPTIVLSYQMLRKIVGLLGLAIPVILFIGSVVVGNCHEIQGSISGYYHTVMRDIFVGTLCIVGFFLFAYNGYGKEDKIAGELACLFALGVAFFPTSIDLPRTCCVIGTASDNPLTSKVHYISAALLFLDFTYFSLFLFTKSDGPKTKEKKSRNKVYVVCGITMLLSIILLGVYFAFFQDCTWLSQYKPVFYLESIALWAFGISWLTKGELVLSDKPHLSHGNTNPIIVTGPTQSLKEQPDQDDTQQQHE